jgi:hypothetical protein
VGRTENRGSGYGVRFPASRSDSRGNIMSIWENLAISVVLTAIKEAVKNPEKKEALKRALLKIKNGIELLYPEE